MLMKKLPWIALLLVLLPSIVSAQCTSCGGGKSVIHARPANDLLWSDYDAPCGSRCGGCRTGNQGCLPPLRCVIPATARVIGRTFDFLIPCGPRSGHGCGLSCIGAGSGCSSCGLGGCGPMLPRWRNICYKQGLGGCSTCGGDGGYVDGEMIGEPTYHHPQHEVLPSPGPVPTPAAPSEAREPAAPTTSYRVVPKTLPSRPMTAAPAKRPANFASTAKPINKVANAGHVTTGTVRRESSVLKATAIEEEEVVVEAPRVTSSKGYGIPKNPLR